MSRYHNVLAWFSVGENVLILKKNVKSANNVRIVFTGHLITLPLIYDYQKSVYQ